MAKMYCVVTNGRLYNSLDSAPSENVFQQLLEELNVLSYLSKDTYVEFEDEYMIKYGDKVDTYNMSFVYRNSTYTASVNKDGKILKDKALLEFFLKLSIKSQKLKEFQQISQDTDVIDVEKINLFLDLFRDSLYVPAERIMYAVSSNLLPALNLVGGSLPKSILYFMLEYNKAKTAIQEYDIPMLGVKFRPTPDKDFVDIPNIDKSILLSEASSGMQSTIPLLLTMRYTLSNNHYHNYVIEEPESNLFPDNQIALLEKILDAIQNSKTYASMYVTTHSPYIINYLNVLIRRYASDTKGVSLNPEDLAVYYVNDNGSVNSLLAKDEETGEFVVDTYDLSEPMQQIFDIYQNLAR